MLLKHHDVEKKILPRSQGRGGMNRDHKNEAQTIRRCNKKMRRYIWGPSLCGSGLVGGRQWPLAPSRPCGAGRVGVEPLSGGGR